MGIKQQLKNIALFYRVNAAFKAKLQERKAARELAYYRRKASEDGMKLPEGHEPLIQKLKQRLGKRGIHPIPKPKGDLHIFLASAANNLEAVLPVIREKLACLNGSRLGWCE
mgnify:CR=1 FL=1